MPVPGRKYHPPGIRDLRLPPDSGVCGLKRLSTRAGTAAGGYHVPPTTNQGAAGLSHFSTTERLTPLDVLSSVFGYDAFRDGQEPVIDELLHGRHVLAVMPTGSGKSLCFQIPGLVRGGLTLVVSPLVALMQDQVSALKLAGVAADSINSSRDRAANIATWERAVSGELRILYLAPERLMTGRMIAALQGLPIRMIAIDEAHCIAQWGPSFRKEYEALGELTRHFPGVPIGAFTATADQVTREEIAQRLFDGEAQTFVTGFDRANIQLNVQAKVRWKDTLLEFLRDHQDESGIVYCLSRRKTDETAAFLCQNGVRALPYHAGMSKEARERNQQAFNADAGVVMVATIAFGMGIDKPDVRFVFHTDIPASIEAYYQEIGRAGRDGDPAHACMLYGLEDIRLRRGFIENADSSDEHKRREHQRLNALLGYCEAPRCRRQLLLSWFGESSEPCGNCDLCLNPAELHDGTREGQMALSAVLRSGQRFGTGHVIDILCGNDTPKVVQFGHQALPTFGVGAEHSRAIWQAILRQLVAGDFLNLDLSGYGALQVTPRGQELLRGEQVFLYRADTLQAKKTRTRSAATRPSVEPGDQSLMDNLKALRTDLAQERGVPAYVIFGDRSLSEMARRKPSTTAEFAEIHGVGAKKLEEFGAMFLDEIALFLQDDESAPEPVVWPEECEF